MVRLRFRGSKIVYKYTKAYNRGVVSVSMDGEERLRLDQYAPEVLWQQEVVLEAHGESAHVVEIRILREKAAKSENYFADIDELRVLP